MNGKSAQMAVHLRVLDDIRSAYTIGILITTVFRMSGMTLWLIMRQPRHIDPL